MTMTPKGAASVEHNPEPLIQRAQEAMAKLLLSATSVDRDVRIEADDAVRNLITFIEGPGWLRRPDYRGRP